MSEPQLFALGIALAWLAGLRVYLTVFSVGLASLLGWVELPPALAVCAEPWVLGTAGVLALVEFGTDKIPGVDSLWDLLHTLLRVPAGAFLAEATLAPADEFGLGWAATGAGVAFASHLLKSGGRALVNTSPEPLSNWTASAGEDALALTALALVFAYPWVALALLLGVALAMLAAMVGLVRLLRRRRRTAAAG